MNFKFPWFTKSNSTSSVKYTTIDASSDLAKLAGPSSNSGVTVTHQTALQASVSFACARVIANGISQIPLKVFQSRDGGGADPHTEHALYSVLHDSPNPNQTSFEWREMVALHLVFAGNSYSMITRDLRGNVQELWPLLPTDIAVEKVGNEIRYKMRRNGAEISLPAEDILHLRGVSWNGYQGLDGVRLAREAIGLALATEEHGARGFSNGATIPGILTTEQPLSPEQLQAVRESFAAAQAGLDNSWQVMVTHGGLKYSPTAVSNDKAQFMETRKFQIEEVCRHFGVLPIMVGATDKVATYASAGQMFLAHLVHTMAPWYARLEQSFNLNLLSQEERAAGIYTKFIDAGILRGSHADRAAYYKTMSDIAAMNPNEIRAREDMNPYDGGEEYRLPMNTEPPGPPGADDGTQEL